MTRVAKLDLCSLLKALITCLLDSTRVQRFNQSNQVLISWLGDCFDTLSLSFFPSITNLSGLPPPSAPTLRPILITPSLSPTGSGIVISLALLRLSLPDREFSPSHSLPSGGISGWAMGMGSAADSRLTNTGGRTAFGLGGRDDGSVLGSGRDGSESDEELLRAGLGAMERGVEFGGVTASFGVESGRGHGAAKGLRPGTPETELDRERRPWDDTGLAERDSEGERPSSRRAENFSPIESAIPSPVNVVVEELADPGKTWKKVDAGVFRAVGGLLNGSGLVKSIKIGPTLSPGDDR